jgi:hypothetical protein
LGWSSLGRAAVLGRVVLAGLGRVVRGVGGVTVGGGGVVAGFLVVAGFVVFCGLTMVVGGVLVVLRRQSVMFAGRMRHGGLLARPPPPRTTAERAGPAIVPPRDRPMTLG